MRNLYDLIILSQTNKASYSIKKSRFIVETMEIQEPTAADGS